MGSYCKKWGHWIVCVKMGVPPGISIKIYIFQYFQWIPMIFNEINGFPGILMGAPGALEISRRREIALRAPARASAATFAAREAAGALR